MICEVSTCNLALRTAYTTAYVTLSSMVCSGQANPSSSCSSWWVKERGRLKIHHGAMRLWSMGNDAHHGLWVVSVPGSHRSTTRQRLVHTRCSIWSGISLRPGRRVVFRLRLQLLQINRMRIDIGLVSFRHACKEMEAMANAGPRTNSVEFCPQKDLTG